MNAENRKTEIDKFKKLFPDNERIIRSGKAYQRFVIQKIEMPKEVGRKYLNIIYDDEGIPYVVMSILEGVTKEEKEKRKKALDEKRAKKRVVVEKYRAEIKDVKAKLREHVKKMEFSLCEPLKIKLVELETEFNDKFGRKRK